MARDRKFICPETGADLAGKSIRKYTKNLYPDVIPPGGQFDEARKRKATLLRMAEEQEAAWGGPAPASSEGGGAEFFALLALVALGAFLLGGGAWLAGASGWSLAMFTLIGWTESQDSAALVNVAGLADPHVRVAGDDIIVPKFASQLMGVFGLGVNITQAQLLSPSLRRILNYQIAPLNIAAEPASPVSFIDLSRMPVVLDAEEALTAQAAEDGAGATRCTVLAWLTDGKAAPVEGDVRTVRATNTSTLTASAWSNGALTFDQSLPAGRYQIVGMRAEAAGLVAARLVLVGGVHRPGCIGFDTASEVEHGAFRQGALGVWGEFEHNTPPTVDFLSVSADTSQVVFLDLIKIG